MNLLLILFLFINAAHLILAVNEPKDGKIRPTFDEIYGKGWDKNAHEKIKLETSPLNSGENALNEQADHDDNIDQDVEAYNSNSTDQNLTQEDLEGIDQSDDETIEGINDGNEFSVQKKREIISKFHAIKKEYKKQLKLTEIERVKIECKIGNKLGVYRDKIYKWKKEFGLSRKTQINKKSFYEKKKREFIKRIDGIKMSQYGEQNKLAKDLGISAETFRCWKKEFGLSVNSQFKYSESEKLKLMRKYYKIKQSNSKISESDIANKLNIGYPTLRKWRKQFVNSVDQHPFSENAGAVQDLIQWEKQFCPFLIKNSVGEHSLPEKRQSFADNDSSEHPMPSSDDTLWAWNFAKKKRTERIEVEHSVKK